MRDPVTVQVAASIDDAQSRAKEVEEAVGELVRLVGWLRGGGELGLGLARAWVVGREVRR